MTPLTAEWVEIAFGLFHSALRELRARIRPNYNSACFHSQQCAEKYLKARLQEAKITFARTPNLVALLNLRLPIEPFWVVLSPQTVSLNVYAIDFRYPGQSAIKAEAKAAVTDGRIIRDAARKSLGLPL